MVGLTGKHFSICVTKEEKNWGMKLMDEREKAFAFHELSLSLYLGGKPTSQIFPSHSFYVAFQSCYLPIHLPGSSLLLWSLVNTSRGFLLCLFGLRCNCPITNRPIAICPNTICTNPQSSRLRA